MSKASIERRFTMRCMPLSWPLGEPAFSEPWRARFAEDISSPRHRTEIAMAIFDLRKRVAFITGGNGGIGLGMAKGLAAAGAAVVIAGRNKSKAKTALAQLQALGAKAEFVELDVTKEASCKQAVADVAKRFGRLDILVNNAGTTVRKQPQDLTAADWNLVME